MADPLAIAAYEELRRIQFRHKLVLPETVEAYVLFLVVKPTVLDPSRTVVSYLQDIQETTTTEQQKALHRKLADHCLVKSGLFRPSLKGDRAQLDFHLSMGSSSYWQAGQTAMADYFEPVSYLLSSSGLAVQK